MLISREERNKEREERKEEKRVNQRDSEGQKREAKRRMKEDPTNARSSLPQQHRHPQPWFLPTSTLPPHPIPFPLFLVNHNRS